MWPRWLQEDKQREATCAFDCSSDSAMAQPWHNGKGWTKEAWEKWTKETGEKAKAAAAAAAAAGPETETERVSGTL